MFLLVSFVISQDLDNNTTTLYVTSDDSDCHSIANHECHIFSFYSNFSFPLNTELIFLPGVHVLPPENHQLGFNHFNSLVIRGNSGASEEKAKLINVSIVILNSHTVTLRNLEIPSLISVGNPNIEVCDMFFNSALAAIRSKILIRNTRFYQSNTTFISLSNTTVQMENVIALTNFTGFILINGIGNHSNLSNITVKCDGCAALTVIGRQDTHSSHVNIRDVTVTGGNIKFQNVYSHLSVSNVKATSTVHQNDYPVLSILNCGSNMSITSAAVDANDFGIFIYDIGNHSNLSNVTVKCDECAALTVIGKKDTHSCHINIRGVTATGGKILIKNVHSHLNVSNFKATVYQNNSCNYTVFSVSDCGSYMSITNVAVDGGQVSIVIAGSHFKFKNFTINIKTTLILTKETFYCYLLSIYGSSNTHNVDITGIRVRGDGTISVNKITSNLNIDDIYTNVGLNVGFNGNNISIGNSYVVGIMQLLYNGDNITLRNITVGYSKDKAIGLSREDDYLWNASALSVRGCGSYISVSNVTLFNGMMVLSQNKNNIYLQDVTVYINSPFSKTNAKKFLDPDFDIQPIGLNVEQNHKHIIVKNIKIWNGSMAVVGNDNDISVSDIYLNSYYIFNGVIVGKNKDNIMLSDVIIDGLAEIIMVLNGNYLTIKNRLQTFQFTMAENGNNILVINVTATDNTSLTFQSNGGNITLNNVTIKRVFNGWGLSFFYNKGSYSLITLINVTVSECHCGIYAYGQSLLNFTSHPSSIINNTSVNNGAGMQIGGGIILSSNIDVYFINNTAHGVGGAIYVDVNILKIESLIEDCTFQNFTPIFVNNTAVVAGNDVYNGIIWKCRHRYLSDSVQEGSKTSPFIEAINCSSSISLKGFPTPLSSHVTSTPIGVCLCTDNGTTDCYKRSIHEQLYPGQYISLPLVTVGMCGGISPAVLVITNTSTVEVLLNSSDSQETKRECKYFSYQLKMVTSERNGTFFVKHKFNSIENQHRLHNSHLSVNVSFFKCPIGLELASKVCQCNNVLNISNVIECNINWMPHPIKRSGNNWLYYNHYYDCTVLHKHCPFDYCNVSSLYLSLEEGDTQCSHERSGILCGGCKAGLSLMLGSNRCHYCDNKYLSLTIAFIVAGIALVAFLTVCNMTVSIGSINGLLFYANIVKLNEVYFFPNGAGIPVLSQFIAWLNLDLGIETCLFNGLDGYWKTWLQYAFPVYIWLLVGAIIVGSHYSSRICRLCGNNAVPVLATLILMSYSKLLQTVTKSLMSSTINCEGVKVKVWSVDGNIDYLGTKHIPLFVTAMLFLTVGLVYTVMVFTAQWLQRYSSKCCNKSSRDPVVKLKPFIDAYVGPYKDKYRFWTGLFLIVRLILTPVFSYTTNTIPQVNNYIIAFISAVALYLSRGIYRYNILNALEAFYFLNLGLVALLNILSSNMGLNEEVTLIITAVSVSLCLVAFIITVIVHVYIKKCHSFFSRKFLKKSIGMEQFNLIDDESKEDEETYSPSRVITRRESLIFDFNIHDSDY